MRPDTAMRRSRRARVGAGALMIAVPCSGAALVAGQALAAPAQQPPHITPRSLRIPYGRDLIVHCSAPAADAGHTVVLQFAPRGGSVWRQLGSTTIAPDGGFRLTAALGQSGAVRALDTSSESVTPLLARVSSGATTPTSTPVPVEVAGRLRVRSRQIAVLGGQAVRVRGQLLPGRAGRRVSLQARQGRGWRTLARTRTAVGGRFVLRYVAGSAGQESIRVSFAGDGLHARSAATAGQMTVYREAEASWYNDGGTTACGFHARYGVANRALPCGTKVGLRYNGRSVTATVDDRGPYVGGRDWDLNQNTASALGFGGVGVVWSSQ
jgi:peptidoglycan lytic transglycosylase